MKHDFNNPVTDTVKHITGLPCECFDCMKNAAYTKQLNDRNIVYSNSYDFPSFDRLTGKDLLNHFTEPKTAADFLGATLRAAKEVVVYKAGKPSKTVKSGSIIGTVDSWIANPTRFVLTDGSTVNVEQGAFDYQTAVDSLRQLEIDRQKRIDAKTKERLEANDNPLYTFGKDFLSFVGLSKWVLLGVVFVIVSAVVYKITK